MVGVKQAERESPQSVVAADYTAAVPERVAAARSPLGLSPSEVERGSKRLVGVEWWRSRVSREALLCAGLAATLGALLVWFGPPGTDFAAHLYQRALFLRHGLTLWDNFWYAGRYSFIDYSVLYYPLAALLGIRALAVATVAVATLAFASVVAREWGPRVRWSSRAFAVVWAGFLLSAEFPFALGVTFVLLALWALQAGHRWRFGALTLLTLAASPVALVFLVVVLAGLVLARRGTRREAVGPALILVASIAIELVLLRLFPGTGRYPFSATEAAMALGFCVVGFACTRRVASAGVLRYVFVVYAVAIAAVYLVPSGIGENIARLRYMAVPLVLLIVGLRRWRPLTPMLALVALALAWNVTPLAAGLVRGESDRTARASVWRAPVAYLHAHLRPDYRVEAVDTTEHWPAFYLAESRIPLVRGWFRQDDFPSDALLYRHLRPAAYKRWLQNLGVAYVVLTRSPPDYSSRQEAALVRSGRAGLRRVWASSEIAIYKVSRPKPIVTGPGRPMLLALRESRLLVRVTRGGTYRVAVHWSPYWHTSAGCLAPTSGGMLRLHTGAAGTIRIAFDIDASRLLDALAGTPPPCAE